MLVLRGVDLLVAQVSANSALFLNVCPDKMLGQPVGQWFDEDSADTLRAASRQEDPVALASGCAWFASFTLFPVPANRVLQREFVSGWRTVSMTLRRLSRGSPGGSQRLLRPLAKAGPIRLLKLLKLSLLETRRLRQKREELRRLIVALDKIARLAFSYSDIRLKSSGITSISSSEKAILGRVAEATEYFEGEFADGFVPSGLNLDKDERERARTNENSSAALQLAEAELR
jgi:hypothetical protein